MDGDITDMRSEDGYAACSAFLSDIDKAARALGLPTASRAYRATFSANYRALFPDNARLYRVDVLETSLDQHSEIWVNGDKFELSPDAIGHGEGLQQAWADLSTLLTRWHGARGLAHDDGTRPGRADLATALVALDVAWAGFERRYISELIAIEDKARQLVVRATNFEKAVSEEQRRGLSEDPHGHERQLVQYIGQLNSVANFKCKGRDDLGYDILVSARRVIQRALAAGSDGDAAVGLEAARLLAADVVESYKAMRAYLREVTKCMERVDPHLCNNPGLVSRLVDWETSWEVGARYVRSAPLLDALCDLVAEIKAAQRVAPALIAMCEDCDVELFLVLPRLVLLLFVADPSRDRAGLIRNLLPHRFTDRGASMGPELQVLAARFAAAVAAVAAAAEVRGGGGGGGVTSAEAARQAAWRVIAKRAIAGGGGASAAEGPEDGCPAGARKAVEDLMHELECWSLELQRHCPQDWNQCSAVLVQCLTGGAPKTSSGKFHV